MSLTPFDSALFSYFNSFDFCCVLNVIGAHQIFTNNDACLTVKNKSYVKPAKEMPSKYCVKEAVTTSSVT